MKKIILAVTAAFVTLAQVNVAEARYQNSNHYSSEYNEFPDPITELLQGADWSNNFAARYKPAKKNTQSYFKQTRIHGSIVAFGHMLQNQGYKISEHPAFGGVHHHSKHSHHYSGNALDVNVVAGNDYSVPYARHKLDQLAAQARAAGYKVLWKVAHHYDHLHLER